MSRVVARWAVPAAYAALLLWLGRQSGDDLPQGGFWAIPGIDKVVHACAYGGLGFLTAWAARIPRPLRAVALGMVAAAVVGLLDEWGQASTAGRDSSGGDLVADLIGGGLGAASAVWLRAWLGGRFIPRQNG